MAESSAADSLADELHMGDGGDNGSLAESSRPRRSRGKVVAVAIALFFGAVLAASAVVAVVTYVRHQNHTDACQRLKEALPVVLTVPQAGQSLDPNSLAALSPSDQQTLRKSHAAFLDTVSAKVQKDYSGCPNNPSPGKFCSSTFEHEDAVAMISNLSPSWKAWASQFQQGVMEDASC